VTDITTADYGVVVDEGTINRVPERPVGDQIEFLGRGFTVAAKVGLMPLLRFAKAAKSGLDSSDVDGMAAMYDLLQQCIVDEEWAVFEQHATTQRADDEDLMDFIKRVMAVLSQRHPTKRPSDSSTGPQSVRPSYGDALSSRVTSRLEQQGRPDLALIVTEAQEARAS
jgi:hypothetical protein